VGLSPLGTAATSGLLYKPQMIDEGDCEATGGMKIGRGNRSIRRKPAPAPLCPPQIPHAQTRARTRAVAVGSQRLTAWAMARPIDCSYLRSNKTIPRDKYPCADWDSNPRPENWVISLRKSYIHTYITALSDRWKYIGDTIWKREPSRN
jgi:hypothetical protein